MTKTGDSQVQSQVMDYNMGPLGNMPRALHQQDLELTTWFSLSGGLGGTGATMVPNYPAFSTSVPGQALRPLPEPIALTHLD